MQIQWYPGHMTKAKRAMKEDIKLIDLVIELVDARVPLGSRNPDIDELAKGKGRIVLLNKADLADDGCTERWIAWFKEHPCTPHQRAQRHGNEADPAAGAGGMQGEN